ncbi:unnamed protein product [Symbiodinium natans]|uniref:Tocopherol cyclase, chloroplastic n=1 Tax=Symbiodinium natans TaxID=878477 RepID=A0A812QNU8_9DINO|nr:unnamed protein product [Symbiodinium natans]
MWRAAAWAALVHASPFEPFPVRPDGPWFEGWFTRIIDQHSNRSVAVIIASFQAKGATNFTSSWAAALVSHANGTMITEQVFPSQSSVRITDRGRPVNKELPRSQPAIFEVESEIGRFAVNDSKSELLLTFPSGLKVEASLDNRVPWDAACKDTCGPEGWAGRLPSGLLPTHYFVHSLGSTATYAVNELRGFGFAHQEANYGSFFPSAWTWVEGISSDGSSQLLLTGGAFTLAELTARQFLLAYRSPRFHWDFRSVNMDHIVAQVDACRSLLVLSASRVLSGRRLELEVRAVPGTFSDPLYFPTREGWSNRPGSVESYRARAWVKVFQHGVLQARCLKLSPRTEQRASVAGVLFGGRKGTRTQPVAAKGQLVEVLPYLDAEVATIVRGAIKHVDDWMHLHFGERAIEIDDSQPPPTSAGESKGEKVEDTNEPETQPWPPRPPSTEKGA